MKNEKVRTRLENLCFYFFVCSLIGFILEECYALMVFDGTLVKRGFLYGPICPIYGFGALILIVTSAAISKKSDSLVIKAIVMTILFTIFEYMVSFVFEAIFGIRWWDYTNEFLNLHGRICLMFSLIWGIVTIFFLKFLYEPLRKAIIKVREKVPRIALDITLIALSILAMTDFVLSIMKYLK